MKDVLFTLFRGFHASREEMAQRILQTLEGIQPGLAVSREIDRVQEGISKLRKRREKLLDLNVAGHLSDEDFGSMIREVGRQLDALREQLHALQSRQDQASSMQQRLQAIKAAFASFDSLATPEDITPALVDAIISSIDVTVTGDAIQLDVHLADGSLLTGEMTAAPHTRGRKKDRSAGHMGKRLIEQAERQMAGK